MSVRLLLVRHGRVDFESSEFIDTPRGRQWDPPLGEVGREQSERLSFRLRLMDQPAAIYASPFTRCLQTLDPTLAALGLERDAVEVVDDLGEVFVGEWEGVRFEDLLAANEDLPRRIRDQEPLYEQAPGAETKEHLQRRVVSAIEERVARHDDGIVLVMVHGGVINAYVGHILGIERAMFFLPENTSVNTVEVDGDRRAIRFLNDTAHLIDPPLFVPPVGVESNSE
jgi:probable phosphoglycerate mutase